MRTRIVVLLVVGAALFVACGPPPSERPREGAPVIVSGQPTRRDEVSAAAPTLAPAGALVEASKPFDARDQRSPSGSPPSSPSPSPSPVPGYVIVATDGAGVNLRTGPSLSASPITTLREGTAVEVLGDPVTAEGRAWRQVRAGDREGWVVAVVVRPR